MTLKMAALDSVVRRILLARFSSKRADSNFVV
jgi:hypothetical protein